MNDTKQTAARHPVEVPAATAKTRFVQIADEIVSVLSTDPNATVRMAVDSAEFSAGASEAIKRAASENAQRLGLGNADWE